MAQLNALERLACPLAENQETGGVQTWLTELIAKNWETVVAGGLFFVLIGSDVVAISRDVLADGKVNLKDKEDLLALGRGTLRIIGSFVGAAALKFALEKNPVATLSTIAAGVVAAVGVSKTIDLAKGVKQAHGSKARVAAIGSAAATAVLTGAVVGTLELGALQLDPEAWLISNAGLAIVAATRPQQVTALIAETRKFIGKK